MGRINKETNNTTVIAVLKFKEFKVSIISCEGKIWERFIRVNSKINLKELNKKLEKPVRSIPFCIVSTSGYSKDEYGVYFINSSKKIKKSTILRAIKAISCYTNISSSEIETRIKKILEKIGE